jgi:hypothetical protein
MMQNGVNFRTGSPEPGGAYWENYGTARPSGNVSGVPCNFNYHKVWPEYSSPDISLVAKLNKMIIKFNTIEDKNQQIATKLKDDIESFYLANRDKLIRKRIR